MLPVMELPNGRKISYCDYADFQKMVKRLRGKNAFTRPFNYLCVTERGSTKGRPHYHALFFLPRYRTDTESTPAQLETILYNAVRSEWRRNIATTIAKKDTKRYKAGEIIPNTRNPIYKPLFTYKCKYVSGVLKRNYDLHYCKEKDGQKGNLDVMYYVTKYIFKPSRYERALYKSLKDQLTPEDFTHVWNKIRSRAYFSTSYGAYTEEEKAYVMRCIELSETTDQLKYYNSYGDSFPLCRYYRRKFVDSRQEIAVIARRGGPIIYQETNDTRYFKKCCDAGRIMRQIGEHDLGDEFEVLFNPDPIAQDVANFQSIVDDFINNKISLNE